MYWKWRENRRNVLLFKSEDSPVPNEMLYSPAVSRTQRWYIKKKKTFYDTMNLSHSRQLSNVITDLKKEKGKKEIQLDTATSLMHVVPHLEQSSLSWFKCRTFEICQCFVSYTVECCWVLRITLLSRSCTVVHVTSGRQIVRGYN